MRILKKYRLGRKRRRFLLRAGRKSLELRCVVNRTNDIRRKDVLVFTTLRNEMVRLPWFLDYYRNLGVNHFLIVDNDSEDGSRQYLAGQPDVSVWSTSHSYKKSRFGVDWLNYLQRKYAHGHWALTVDPDEFFIYPFCDTRPIRGLTDWLDACEIKSFGAMLLDMYPKGPINSVTYETGTDPFKTACWFDSGNYVISKNQEYGNLWIQGGPRARVFFADNPELAPALNKTPLVKWDRSYAYVSSTHNLLPRSLNMVYDQWGGERTSGLLLHAKLLATFDEKAQEELCRKQHYAGSQEYEVYANILEENPDFWCKWSEKYINWRQLEILGLMSKGNWA